MKKSVAQGKTKSIMIPNVDRADYDALSRMALENERSLAQQMRWLIKKEVGHGVSKEYRAEGK